MAKTIYIITGDVETGKTRWLSGAIDYLKSEDKVVSGAITPGIWQQGNKLGIDAVFLPGGEKFNLAKRNENNDGFSKKWDFNNAAMAKINDHFASINFADYLIVDELGPLELERGEGLTNAADLLISGKFNTALVVVRPHLVDKAKILLDSFNIEVLESSNLPKYDALL